MSTYTEDKAEVIKLLNSIISIVYKDYPRKDIKRAAMRGVINTLHEAKHECVDTLDRKIERMYETAWEIYNSPDF